jgi:hypothetical protein
MQQKWDTTLAITPMAKWFLTGGGFVWMILAEDRGLLTPERRALAWKKHDERLLARESVVGVVRINIVRK